jgi:hypothetical protein
MFLPPTRLHAVITQKTISLNFTIVKTSNFHQFFTLDDKFEKYDSLFI